MNIFKQTLKHYFSIIDNNLFSFDSILGSDSYF